MNPNAAKWYLDARIPDITIDRLGSSESLQKQFGLTELPEDPRLRGELLEMQANHLRIIKQHANYWMALSQYEMQDYGHFDQLSRQSRIATTTRSHSMRDTIVPGRSRPRGRSIRPVAST